MATPDVRDQPTAPPAGISARERVKNLIPRGLLVRDLGAGAGSRLLLTFDDGPSPEVTPGVLSRLAQYQARALFFVVGKRVEAHPDLVRSLTAGGHKIGNHTYSHRNDRDPGFLDYLADVRRCQQLVETIAGDSPKHFRPPKGHLSPTSLTVPRLLGMRTMNWTLNVRDWACRTSEQALAAAQALDSQVKAGQIVLLHDDNPAVLDLLDYVLPRLAERGFDLHSAIDMV
jgi:peptidoglycan/xylan/chitin deacetylase (PgdA/CDA1 family)